VLNEACHQLAAWRALGPALTLNVNLSAQQLRQLRCQLGQGYHFSQPLAGDELTGYLERALDAGRRAA
jgi:EAL domain-containing protein (putative c-di-GMP-specific phosphodiesterase class I)